MKDVVSILEPLDVARYLNTCSDEEFAETFVAFDKLHNFGDDSPLTKENMVSFKSEILMNKIKDILDEIIPIESECDTMAWWKGGNNE